MVRWFQGFQIYRKIFDKENAFCFLVRYEIFWSMETLKNANCSTWWAWVINIRNITDTAPSPTTNLPRGFSENMPQFIEIWQTRTDQDRPGQTRTDQDRPRHTPIDHDRPVQTTTDQDRQGQTTTDQNGPGGTRTD